MRPAIAATPTAENTVTDTAAAGSSGGSLPRPVPNVVLVSIACFSCVFARMSTGYVRGPRAAVSNGYQLLRALGRLRPHLREKNYIADAGAVGQEHHQPVDAKARARGGRHAVLEGADVIGVVVHRLLVSRLLLLHLLEEARRLVLGVVQLGEAIGDLLCVDEELEAVGELRIGIAAARKRRHFRRELGEEGRLDQVLLAHAFE